LPLSFRKKHNSFSALVKNKTFLLRSISKQRFNQGKVLAGGLMIRVLILLLHLFSALAWSKDLDFSQLPAEKILKVTGHPDYAPVIWKSTETGELKGMAVEMLRQAFKDTGVQLKFVAIDTWGRAQKEVEDGRVDLLLPPYKNAERLKYYSYSEKPMLMDESVVFVKKGKRFSFEKLPDLLGKMGVAIISDSFGDEFDQFDREKLKMTRIPTTEQCFSLLMKGRAGFVVAGSSAGKAVAAKMKILKEVQILKKRIVVTGMYAAISKKSGWDRQQVHGFLDQQFSKMNDGKLVPRLESKYLQEFGKEK
jgi:polar amino acid transport system substrate-binding protein